MINFGYWIQFVTNLIYFHLSKQTQNHRYSSFSLIDSDFEHEPSVGDEIILEVEIQYLILSNIFHSIQILTID